MISVAMATYNGEKYLLEQLDSIREQTRAVDEVIISDDVSSDGTRELIRRYLEQYRLEGWTLIENSENLGYADNFRQALRHTHGEIVFLCDQDDIWEPDKVERMARLMEEDPSILTLNSAYTYIDALGEEIPYTNPRRDYSGAIRRVSYTDFVKDFGYPGMSMALRASIRELFLQAHPREKEAHDFVMNTLSALQGGMAFFGVRLARYRQHGNNVIGAQQRTQARGDTDERLVQARLYRMHDRLCLELIHYLQKRGEELEPECRWTVRQAEIDERRVAYLRKKSVAGWLGNLGGIRRYQSAKTYVGDLLYLLNLAKFFK